MTLGTIAKLIRMAGYILSFAVGLALWPKLMEWGFKLENVNFALALILGWFCLPVSMMITHVISSITMRIASTIDTTSKCVSLSTQIQRASMLGVIATLGSCGVMASGYEPEYPLTLIYNIDLSGKYR